LHGAELRLTSLSLTDVSPATTLSRLSGPRIALDGDGNVQKDALPLIFRG
jgi:hypothetical protein